MNKNKNLWIGIVVIVVVVLLGWWLMNKNSTTVSDTSTQATEDTTAGSADMGTAAPLSYAQALAKYKDARLQLDSVCQASPDKMTFKNNQLLMVDNRAPVARTVKVGSTFGIKAYGFKIVKLSSGNLPATWLVDCGTSQNVASILIEK
jgi:hypothetical protein